MYLPPTKRIIAGSLHKFNKLLKKPVVKLGKKQVYAFIDAQNIDKCVKEAKWKINWKVFRQWLAQDYGVTTAYMHLGYVSEFEELYLQLNDAGFQIALKETVPIVDNRPTLTKAPIRTKGNVDVDLVVNVWREYANYDQAIIISGDGDFASLIQHLLDNEKLQNIIVPGFYSSLLHKFDAYIVKLEDYREQLSYIHTTPKRPRLPVGDENASARRRARRSLNQQHKPTILQTVRPARSKTLKVKPAGNRQPVRQGFKEHLPFLKK